MSEMGDIKWYMLGFVLATTLYLFVNLTDAILTLSVCTVTILILYNKRIIYIILRTLPRDIRFLFRIYRMVSKSRNYAKKNLSVVHLFRIQLHKNPKNHCFLFEDEIWTREDVDVYSNRVAQVFLAEGFRKGDVIALVMDNRPEYICTWLGLAKLGVITALINPSLKRQSLQHCIMAANVKAIIVVHELLKVVEEIKPSLPGSVVVYQSGGSVDLSGVVELKRLMDSASTECPVISDTLCYNDQLLYIYTSGTTGLPKAAILPNSRFMLATLAAECMLDLRPDDVVYNPLPLYHTAGGACGAGSALTFGTPVVLKAKFSASAYFPDCVKYNATVGQYIGEMCRYILAVPPCPTDTEHRVRLMFGNGMQPNIWGRFVRRFNIPQVMEIYGATEGNTNIANLDNTVGAVGSLPRFLPLSFYPVAIIRVDVESGEPVRNYNGLCIRCDIDEPGMFVGLIKANNPTREFFGYVDKEASKKKVICDVFKHGDKAFVSGDLMVMDELGYIYFKDRTGDTFRWKGENVATSEVEAVISNVAGLRDATVYGVEVGELEGRAGMIALVDPDHDFDFDSLADCLDSELPPYARPLFVRVLTSMDMTGTFKIKKIQLQQEGFNPGVLKDKVYFRQGGSFVPIDADLYGRILAGQVKM